jgi:glutathione S-transferase
MLKLYGFSKVNAVARGHTRDLRVLWALEEMQRKRAVIPS